MCFALPVLASGKLKRPITYLELKKAGITPPQSFMYIHNKERLVDYFLGVFRRNGKDVEVFGRFV